MRSKSQLAFIFIFFSFLSPNALGQEKNREFFERFQNGAYTENLPLIRKLAEEGDATAQYYMGEAYFNGWGVKIDNQVALIWIQKSAQQENKQALEIYSANLSPVQLEKAQQEAQCWIANNITGN